KEVDAPAGADDSFVVDAVRNAHAWSEETKVLRTPAVERVIRVARKIQSAVDRLTVHRLSLQSRIQLRWIEGSEPIVAFAPNAGDLPANAGGHCKPGCRLPN